MTTIQELQKQIQKLQHQLEELKDEYDTSQQNVILVQLEKKEMQQELEQIKQENTELTENNIGLQSIANTMEIEREHLFHPTMKELQSTHLEKSKLKSQLAIKTQNIQKLNTENIQIKQENEKYKQGLQKYDSKLRKKEAISSQLINTLRNQLETLKQENDELNTKLFKCELDLYSIRKQALSNSDDEKVLVSNQIQESLLNHMQDDIEININMDHDAYENTYENTSDISGSDIDISETQTQTQPNVPCVPCVPCVKGRKTSITVSFNDLATVLQETDSGYSLRSKLMSMQQTQKSSCALIEIDEMIKDTDCVDYAMTYDLNDNQTMTELYHNLNKDTEVIKRLRIENKLLVETHLEIQKELKTKLEKKQKKINSLKEKNESLQMTISKKSCNLVPWCR